MRGTVTLAGSFTVIQDGDIAIEIDEQRVRPPPQTTSGTFANGDLVNGTVSTFTVVVPEPAAVALAAIGAAAAAWTLRRRRPL